MNKMNEIKRNFLYEIIRYEMSTEIQIVVANEFLGKNGNRNIFPNTDDGLENLLCATDRSEIVRAIYFGEYKWTDKCVGFNDYGNIESFDDAWDAVDIYQFIDWLIDGEEDDFIGSTYMIMQEDEIADMLNRFVEYFADEFGYDYEQVESWVFSKDFTAKQLCREDWNDLHKDYLNYEQK
jgi:hypothetical protein